MVAHFGIEQNSLEWFEIKHCKIGGSRAKELFVKTDTLFFRLLAETIEPFNEDFEEGYQSESMQNGSFLEPQARIELNKYTGLNFIECGWVQSDNNLLGISPDGITAELTEQAEIKCLQAIAHLKIVVSNEIPLEHINQCIHAFTVNDKLEKFYFCAYRPECEVKPLFVKELNRNSLVNNGTKAKPVMVKIKDLVAESIKEAVILQTKINKTIEQLKF